MSLSFRAQPVAYVALFVALGGTSYAAVALPAGSVGTRQLRNGAVTNAKIASHSLRASAFAAGVVPKGLKTEIIPGIFGLPSCPSSGCPALSPGTSVTLGVNCPAGTTIVGGGYSTPYPADVEVSADRPVAAGQGNPIAGAGGGWDVVFTLVKANDQVLGTPYAVCALT